MNPGRSSATQCESKDIQFTPYIRLVPPNLVKYKVSFNENE
jgi:hypothetical protein